MADDPEWSLLVIDFVNTLTRLKQARDAVKEATDDLERIWRVARKLVEENKL